MTIGVAIALYNGERFLRNQLDSIRQQTRQPDYVVMCDDGSRDNTVRLVQEYIKEFDLQESWHVIINEQNLGYARNFYKAMECCETDVIYLCDQDDIWSLDKLEKMTSVMENHPQILLLSSKFGMIDANGQEMHGVLERKAKQTGALKQISHLDLLRAFYWPGMAMCVRKSFFDSIAEKVKNHTVAHDRVLAHGAAEQNGFYEMDAVCQYHRRHDSNTANEEHRIFKLLNLKRKLRDIDDHLQMLEGLLAIPDFLGDEANRLLQESLRLTQSRYAALKERSLKKLNLMYRQDANRLLRTVSYLCDIWLLCFGDY